jgi:chitinase
VYANVPIAPSPTYASTPTPTSTSSDTLPPTVTILSPVNGGTVSRRSKVTITASASEGVTHVSYSVNGSLLCTSTTSPYSCSWFVPGKPNATYTITATAYDVAGYTGTNSVSLTAK